MIPQALLLFQPDSPAQQAVKEQILFAFNAFGPQLYTRANPLCHFTVSSMVFNPQMTHTLMVYHNIYQSWSWTGGHTDGDPDFWAVAQREVQEETGVKVGCALSPLPLRWDVLPVKAHEKHGRPVAPHLHLNASYACIADPLAPLSICPEENTGVRWLPVKELSRYCSEPEMLPVYQWIFQRAQQLRAEEPKTLCPLQPE